VTLIPPPRGHVLWQGRWTDRSVHWALKPDEVTAALAPDDQVDTARPTLGHDQTIYLGRAPSRALPGGGRLVFDARLPAAVVDTVEATLKETIDALTDAFGEGPGGPVGVMMVQVSGDRFIGNVSGGRSMTLNIIGSGAERAAVRGQIQRFVRHEATHWWDAGVRQSDPQASWLGEGNAEWWALRLGVAQGASLDAARSELEFALNSCLQMATSLPPKLRDWQGYPSAMYPCGMSLIALAQGLRRPQGMAFRELADLFPKNSVLTPDGVAAWAGADFARVLDAPSFTTALAAAYRDKGWAQDEPLDPTRLPSPPSRLRLVPERVAFLFTLPSAPTSRRGSAAP
jgi:hypothetical protein